MNSKLPGFFRLLLLLLLLAAPIIAKAQFTNFITNGNDGQLYDGTTQYHFLSFNAGSFITTSYAWEPFEQDDFFHSVQQLGGTVVRFMPPYHASSITPASDALITGYVNGQVQYNEENWRRVDKAIQTAGQYGIRVIIPTLFHNSSSGDATVWSGYVGKNATQFYACDITALSAYKQFLSWLANRQNFYTKTYYKDDPTILCWETGNEIDPGNGTWVSNIAAYEKSIDPKHLVMDGRTYVAPNGLDDANVDIVTKHYYWNNPTGSLTVDYNTTVGKKAFVAGEFGFLDPNPFTDFTNAVVNTGMTGACMWELQPHSDSGGFVEWSIDQNPVSFAFQGLRWPGFTSGNPFYETAQLTQMRNLAYAIRGLSVPPVPVPAAPTGLRIFEPNVGELSWRGSVGASGYNIQRATSASGPWTTIATGVSDAVAPSKSKWHESLYPAYNDGPPLYSDTSATLNSVYYYQVVATNTSGTSTPSNIVTTTVSRMAIVDELSDFSKMFAHTNLVLAPAYLEQHRDDRDRLQSGDGTAATAIYQTPANVVNFALEVTANTNVSGNYLNLSISTSPDNVTYSPITCNKTSYTSVPYYPIPQATPYNIYKASTQIPAGTRYVKLQLNDNTTEFLRAEVEYGTATAPVVNAEVEDLRVVASTDDPNTPFNEMAASSGAACTYASTQVGDYVVYRVFVPVAGTYNVSTTYKKGPNRGVVSLSIANSATGTYTTLGGGTDLYSAALQYVNVPSGSMNFPAAGDYYFKYSVTGRDGYSTGYNLVLDVIKLQ